MDAKTDDKQNEASGTKAAPGISAPAGEKPAAPAALKSHAPTCEACEKPAVAANPPVSSTVPFKRGFCSECTTKKVALVRPIEHWAKAKGMLPRILEQGGVTISGKLRAAVQNPKHADFHRARAFSGWPVGFELTEAEFDKAVSESATPTFR